MYLVLGKEHKKCQKGRKIVTIKEIPGFWPRGCVFKEGGHRGTALSMVFGCAVAGLIRYERREPVVQIKWLACVFVIAFTLTGCASLEEDLNRYGYGPMSEDMKLSDQGFDALSQGNYQEAEKYLQEALSLNPLNPYALLNMGVVYQNTGRLEKARLMYIKVMAQNPDAMAVRSNMNGYVGKSLGEIAGENYEALQRKMKVE
jgi:tetratricopeptide (TPR) repeat protein